MPAPTRYPPPFWDDLDALRGALDDMRADRDRAAATLRRWNTGDEADWDAYDSAEREFDICDKWAAEIRGRIVQLGGDA